MTIKELTSASHTSGTPSAFSVNGAARQIGIGRTTLYELIRQGRVRTIKLGTRTLIRASEIARFLDELEAKQGA